MFALLEGLGFEALPGVGERVYRHRPTGMLLVFSIADGASVVTGADLASVQLRLEQNGLIDRPLVHLLGARGKATNNDRS